MKRNKFSLSNYRLATMKMGKLYPVQWINIKPGDSMSAVSSMLVRTLPLQAPVMHPVHVRVHHWFVPLRLIWDEFEEFITGGPDGENATIHPQMDILTAQNQVGMLPDHMGVPPKGSTVENVNALPFRAYNLIWNENYRDPDLSPELVNDKSSGVTTLTSHTLMPVAWEKDLFTTCRPEPQKGPDVYIPLGTRAPIKGLAKGNNGTFGGSNVSVRETDGSAPVTYTSAGVIDGGAADTQFWVEQDPNNAGYPNIWADLSLAESATVNQYRIALAVQRFMETRQRTGSRYVEYLRSLGINPSDARLQRPEYLGGGRQTIQFSEVLQTAPFDDGGDVSPVGELKGHGIGGVRSNKFMRFFEEHGIMMTCVSVLPKTMYVNGLSKDFMMNTKYDYHQKELEHVGEEEVLTRELYEDVSPATTIFGYRPRYENYRRKESSIAGQFRTTLNFWHYARIFSSAPALNDDFVKADPTDRVYSVQGEDELFIKCINSVKMRRMLSKNGTPLTF